MLMQIFNIVITESFNISLVISLVIIARFLLKKSPKIFSYALWGVVLFRLVCPFTLESDFGLIPSSKPVETYSDFVEKPTPTYDNYSNESNFTPSVAPAIPSVTPAPNVEMVTSTQIDWYSIVGYIWLIGVVVMLGYGVREFVQLKQSLIGATRWKDCRYGDNIYLCDYIKSPFVMGMFKAKIYIPSNIINRDLDYIISHEKHHIKRLDHLTRIVGFLTLAVHWFNPLVWVAFVVSGKDMELSCDEYVLGRATSSMNSNSSVDIRAEYSQALLYFACNLTNRRKLLAITPHAFGESVTLNKCATKERIVNIMTYQKTAVWVTVLLAVLVGFTSVALASDRTPDEVEVTTVINEQVALTCDETPLINSRIITVGNEFADSIDIKEISYDLGGQYADEYQLYTVLEEKYTYVLSFYEPLEFPTLIKFNDENLYWINLNNDCFEYNFSTQNIRQLDINVSYFEVSSDWLIYSYTIVNSNNLEVDDNLYLYDLNNGTTQIIKEYQLEYNSDSDKFYNRNFFEKFAEDGSGNIVFFTENSLVLYNPYTNTIEYEYAVNFDEIFAIKSVTVSGDTVEIICSEQVYKIDRATNVGKSIEIVPDNSTELLDFMYPIKELNLTVLNQNNAPITNANVIISPLYVTDKPYESYFVTDNNGLALGTMNDMFPTGEYKIEVWLTGENGYEKAYVNQMITSTNYENLVVTVPTTSENKDKYSFSNRTDIYLVDVDETPIANAIVELKPTAPVPAVGSMYGFDTFNKFAYTDNDGRATFDNVVQGDYMMNYWYDSAYPGSALITTTDGIDEYIFNALFE